MPQLMHVVVIVTFVGAVVPLALFTMNVFLFRRLAKRDRSEDLRAVSVLIPARNEERAIAVALNHVLSSEDVTVEVVVYDDESEDQTAATVAWLAGQDSRVRLLSGTTPPKGWNGKQYGCSVLAEAARYDTLLFLDADVHLERDGVARLATTLAHSNAALISALPRQITLTWMERLIVPLIHFVLLGYLPMIRMRRTTNPAYAAGCGQVFMTTKAAYRRAGGHAAIMASRHDGVQLPRAFRRQGLSSDIFDGSDVATCRMYQDKGAVWRGFAKNADEGLGSKRGIVPWTVILLVGQVLPWFLLPLTALASDARLLVLVAMAASAGWVVRGASALRYRQPLLSALLHPLGVLILVSIQWHAWWRRRSGEATAWKGRGPTESVPS